MKIYIYRLYDRQTHSVQDQIIVGDPTQSIIFSGTYMENGLIEAFHFEGKACNATRYFTYHDYGHYVREAALYVSFDDIEQAFKD
jgi:hypothetical protein